MARSSSLTEAEAGISCFASSLSGFRGVLKHRYSDFIVNEVARNGTLVRLTSFDLPTECVDVTEAEKAAPSADADHSKALESFRVLCGDADCDALRGLLERMSAGGDSDVSPVILSPDADKAHRSEVHNCFKKNFKFLITDTVEHSDGVQKCIRVRLGSGTGGGRGGGGRGRKRKNMGGSGWRDDSPFDSRGSSNWLDHVGKFLRFHLYKENKDTQEALGVIGKMLGLQSRSFGFAGTKDKRAVTTQQVTVFKVSASKLSAINNRLFGIKVGNFWYMTKHSILLCLQPCHSFHMMSMLLQLTNPFQLPVKELILSSYVKEGLVLGQLMGNRFTITLRGIVAESEDIIKTAVDGLGKNGFINYYGLQRFGSGSVPTHIVGAALLRGEWKRAVSFILDPRDGERDDINEVRKHYKEHGDIDRALRNFARHLVAERAILQCLKKCPGNYLQALKGIPRTLRLMYVHSYQSYLWNHATSMRVEKYGISQVVEGDLVYDKECSSGEATSVYTSEANDGHANSSEIDLCSETQPEETIQSVKKVDSEDLLKETYTFDDVVLPLPGSQALFPGNEVAEIYHDLARKRPIDFEWELMNYTDDSSSLAETDLDMLSRTKPTEEDKLVSGNQSEDKLEKPSDTSLPTNGSSFTENKPISSPDTIPSKLAIKLAFTLPASSYATMAIRELLKTSTSIAYQKTLGC